MGDVARVKRDTDNGETEATAQEGAALPGQKHRRSEPRIEGGAQAKPWDPNTAELRTSIMTRMR